MSYISREQVLEKEKYLDDWNIDLRYVDIEDIKSIPSADVRENIHGEWIDKGSLSCRCSKCGCKNNKETVFCPNCGADMRGSANG